MDIRWHGHACFELCGSNNTILIDPHDGKSIGIKPPVSNANIVLVTHNHMDHNAVRVVKGVHNDFISNIGSVDINGITIEGYPSFHDSYKGDRYGTNTIYKFTLDGITVCHTGDLGDIPSPETVEAIKGCDILFVAVGELYTMPIYKVIEFIEMVKPSIIIPMHYRVGGLTIPLKPLDEFIKFVPEETVLYVGNEVELWPEDLDDFLGCWVFDR